MQIFERLVWKDCFHFDCFIQLVQLQLVELELHFKNATEKRDSNMK